MTEKEIDDQFVTLSDSVNWWINQVNDTLEQCEALEELIDNNAGEYPVNEELMEKRGELERKLSLLIGKGRHETNNVIQLEKSIAEYEKNKKKK